MRIKDDNEIKNILKIISPGTNLREGLENILRAKTGGLIVFGDSEEVMRIVNRVSRDNSRTPMQWSDEENAGFSTEKPWMRMNSNYHSINVTNEKDNTESVLCYYKKMIALRKSSSALRTGKYQDLLPDHQSVFSYLREDDNGCFWIVMNMSDEKVDGISVPLINQKKSLCISNDSDREVSDFIEAETEIKLSPWEANVWEVL